MTIEKRLPGMNHNKAPPGAMEMLNDMHERVSRIETRLSRLMLALGFDMDGKPLPAPNDKRQTK
jgi:hypothetical protein